jgi:hypothetical protein
MIVTPRSEVSPGSPCSRGGPERLLCTGRLFTQSGHGLALRAGIPGYNNV